MEEATPSESNAEAFVGILASAVAADGKFVAPELQLIQLMTSHHRYTRHLRNEVLESIILRVRQFVLQSGARVALDHYAKQLPMEWYGTAFLCALDLVYVDGEPHQHEEAFILHLAELFGIIPETVEHFTAVFKEKHGILS